MNLFCGIGLVSVEKYRYRYSKKIPIFTDTDTDPPSLIERSGKSNSNKCDNKLTYSKNKTISTNAINVGKKVDCGLCKADKKDYHHNMDVCPVYTTAKLKYDKLRNLKACTKCSFLNHQTSKCVFKFKSPCRFCQGGHMSFLCLKPKSLNNNTATCRVEKEQNEESGDDNDDVINNESHLLVVEASHMSNATTTMVLPTFTAHLKSEKFDLPVRCFKDSGCQQTFICDTIASILDLPIVKSQVPLKVHGFNSSKMIYTKIVRIKLLIGSKEFDHDAICIDNIRTQFSTEGIKPVIDEFTSKGYALADENYSHIHTDKVNNIDLIVGTDLDHILPISYVNFGDPNKPNTLSSYINSPVGVMFSGDVDKMRSNLSHLPVSSVSELVTTSLSCTVPSSPDSTPLGDGEEEGGSGALYREGEGGVVDGLDAAAVVADVANLDQDVPLGYFRGKSILNISDDELDKQFSEIIDIYETEQDSLYTDTNEKLVEFVLENTVRDVDGRLICPITWNAKNCHLLARNYNLAKKVLESTSKTLLKDDVKLKLYNEVLREQEKKNIIERIEDLPRFLEEHPEASFLCHMGVFRLDHESTKCRVVFMSNMYERFNNGISHNMAMLSGPNLNPKILTALLLNRFDQYQFIFDIKKAFLNIKLFECDKNRLCFLWYRNVERGDFTLIGYKNARLSFGLSCSPTILLLSIYRILILDETDDTRLNAIKRKVFNCIYMDNGGYSCNSEGDLMEAYNRIDGIFEPYGMELQQFCTNHQGLQTQIDERFSEHTPKEVKLLGSVWNREKDTLSPHKLTLDKEANTKRKVLASINSVYDLMNVYGPLLLRSKLFVQRLQSDPNQGWDSVLSDELLHEWHIIVKQANATPIIGVERCVGSRSSTYELFAFTDASKEAFGTVIFIKDLTCKKVTYLLSKSRLIGKFAAKRSIPSQECNAIAFAVETIQDVVKSLCSDDVVLPISVESISVFTDSMVCLHWLRAYSVSFDKQRNISVFVKNKLRQIDQMCRSMTVTFRHVAGEENPADHLTRPVSYKVLSNTSFYTGPEFLTRDYTPEDSDLSVTLPNVNCKLTDEVLHGVGLSCSTSSDANSPLAQAQAPSSDAKSPMAQAHALSSDAKSPLAQAHALSSDAKSPLAQAHLFPRSGNTISSIINIEKYSSLTFLINVTTNVFRFVNNIKKRYKARSRKEIKIVDDADINKFAFNFLVAHDQRNHFEKVFAYLESNRKVISEMPDLVSRLNLYKDDAVLKVKGKFSKKNRNLVLLPKDSHLTKLIVQNMHNALGHTGLYAVLRHLRENYWVQSYFSVVSKILKQCILCKRINARPIRLNQNCYRDFRINPPKKPFSSVMIDYLGPFTVKLSNKNVKVWILAITCLWTRAINLKICQSAKCSDFLRALQMHCYDHGLFQSCVADQGSQIQSGTNALYTFLSDYETKKFLSSYGIKEISFQHYAKGNSALGSLIETMVKQVKILIAKAIRGNVLDYFEFQLFVAKAVNLINKRPIGFKEGLRQSLPDEVPGCITPELILKGYESIPIGIVPQLEPVEDDCGEVNVNEEYAKLRAVRERMVDLYHKEFLTNLVQQSVDKAHRYKPVMHTLIKPGDIVLLVDKFLKRYKYPMGRVLSVETNNLGEVTAAKIRKGDTREIVYRHSSSLILLMSPDSEEDSEPRLSDDRSVDKKVTVGKRRSERAAATECRRKLRNLEKQGDLDC